MGRGEGVSIHGKRLCSRGAWTLGGLLWAAAVVLPPPVAKASHSTEELVELCEKGFGQGTACLRAAERLLPREGDAGDRPRALELLLVGCEQGDPDACNLAGNLRRHDGEEAAALDLYLQGCDHAWAWGFMACANAGVCLLRGMGAPADSRRAAELLDKACTHDVSAGCHHRGQMYLDDGQLDAALVAWSRCLEIAEPERRHRPLPVATALNNLAYLHLRRGEHEESIEHYEQAVAIREQEQGREHLDTAVVLRNLAAAHAESGAPVSAADIAGRVSAIRTRSLGPEHPLTTEALHEQAMYLVDTGDAETAFGLWQRVIDLRLATIGEDHEDTARAFQNPGMQHHDRGEYAAALPLLERAAAIRERLHSEDDPRLAAARNNVGSTLVGLGRPREALPWLEGALEVRRTALGCHEDTVAGYSNLALAYSGLGDHGAAVDLLEEALTLAEECLGGQSAGTAAVLASLGGALHHRGDHRRAIEVLERGIQVGEAAGAEGADATEAALNNLSASLLATGDISAAMSSLERILAREAAGGHPRVGSLMNNLGMAAQAARQYERAEQLFRQAVEHWTSTLGPSHPDTMLATNNLSVLLGLQGRTDEALPLARAVLAHRREANGPTHLATGEALNNLGGLHQQRGEVAEARELFEQALPVMEAALGTTHPDLARPLNNLALCAERTGDVDGAIRAYERAAEVVARGRGDAAPELAVVLQNHGLLRARMGEEHEALDLLSRSLEIEDLQLARSLVISSPEEIWILLDSLSLSGEVATSLHLDHWPESEEAARLALRTNLRRKGASVDAGVDTWHRVRAGMDEEGRRLLERLDERMTAAEAAHHSASSGDVDPAALSAAASAMAEVHAIEVQLARHNPLREREVELADLERVAARLPENGALVEWVVYTRLDLEPERAFARVGLPHYAAYVLRADGRVDGVSVGPVARVDSAVDGLRAVLGRTGDPTQAAIEAQELVWAPIASLLEGVEHVVIASDGELGLLPWDALVAPDGRYLIEHHEITTLTSGRDLLRPAVGGVAPGPGLVVAAVEFEPVDVADVSPADEGETSANSCLGPWAPLPGTADEGRRIHERLEGSELRTGSEATENLLLGTRSPRILHVASHGCFEGEDAPSAVTDGRGARRVPGEIREGGMPLVTVAEAFGLPPRARRDSLLRSGIVLAGANGAPGREDNGWLSAAEIARMDLRGTELAVLSACETGVGDVRVGDGVHGLRRALVLAGARTQVLSLWKVDDAATADLMVAFYDRLLAGEPRGEALRQAKLEMLRSADRAHPRYWASFVLSGSWGPMEFQAP